MYYTSLLVVLLQLSTASWARSVVRTPGKRQSFDFINITQYNSTPSPVEVSIALNAGGRNQTAPLLYGWMHEDISHSGDGGIYGEALVNRAFQGSGAIIGPVPGIPGSSVQYSENPILPWGPVITGWQGIGGVNLSLTLLHPLSDALPVALQMDIPWGVTGQVGILNEGWWGIDVRPGTYNASFYILSNKPRNNGTLSHIDVSLRSNLTDDVWCTSTIPFSEGQNVSSFEWTQYQVQLENSVKAPNSNNTFAITFDASEVAGNTYYFSLVSLFPETFNNRPNGIRKDLGQAIVDLGTKILRFPGGNNIEGYSIDQRWKWNETIGPLKDRKGRVGDWGYTNTNGLGLMEYLQFCEDGGIEPVLAVYAGFSLDIWGQDGVSFPEDRMGDVLADILNELEYVTGDASTTTYGALRSSHGHPDPFVLNYVEIGNEDWFSSTYPYRFPILYQGIKQAYPNLTLISTAYDENANYNISIPQGGMWDTHHYEEPSFFLEGFDYWDNWQETTGNEGVTVFVGEYSVFQVDTPDGVVNFSMPLGQHIFYPTLMAAIGEGVYLLGCERNPGVVKMSSYAPSLVNLNWQNWTPDLVAFTADHDQTVLSASYYLQQVFARYRGSETLEVMNRGEGGFDPLWWVATVTETEEEGGGGGGGGSGTTVYFKVINSGNSSVDLTVEFVDGGFSEVNGTILTHADIGAFNYLGNATAVSPAPITNLPTAAAGAGQAEGETTSTFNWAVPPWSINVLEFRMS
ncbi:hypothetical protein LTR20_005855 [Exophiala xenobiotica]|nr:hypothetical protein LTR40_006981 [Exophiala xenobiotica]KAK5357892.1 hypothetical protein LTS13_011101 [Exophiala xenobiotica]KAK5396170.1 hypothetical protein LTR79_006924 [Exophiala xenobiotica]KAK5424124.1 hypothetical protein LTR90_001470 [Exophiala xenobiotica]KAK5461906.1 hypothetical protein LTR20_005855 [Exophiala xenobiotica]